MTLPRFQIADVRAYYERHTRAFVTFGQGGGAMHRAVRAPGATREQAFHYVEDRIAELARSLSPAAGELHLLDLGCGVGASLCYLARKLPMRGTGVTLSPLQARMAAQRIRAEGLADRVRCVEADYTDLPPGIADMDLAYAIESFVHGPAPERFFAEAARVIRPGGLLVICDDFKRVTSDPAASRVIDRFCRGWHVNTLLTRDEVQAMVRAAGFEHVSTDDLTPAVELYRWRDRLIDVLGVVVGWVPFARRRVDYLLGGSALQRGLARGWLGYDVGVFRRKLTTTG